MTSAVRDDLPLGKEAANVTTYTPSLLCSIDRQETRDGLGITDNLPFRGEDAWTCYEFSWLDAKGKPEVATVKAQVPCNSPCIVESKSMKLYLNSFAQTTFASRTELLRTLDSDLAIAFQAPVIVALLDVDQVMTQATQLPGTCIDHLDAEVSAYQLDSTLLSVEEPAMDAKETLYSHLFRSVCPITGQPDWASVMIQYIGLKIAPSSLLKYLISYRTHAAFHEATVEQIFADIQSRCEPEELTVYGRFLRRGGIDINPFRSTVDSVAPAIRLNRQ
jgi:7-cyano-7-deazaguanine reductase